MMSKVRFIFSPGAIEDFREIFKNEKFTREDALRELTKSSQHAQLQRTKSSGTRVFRSGLPREYYLLADPPGSRGSSRVRALAPAQSSGTSVTKSPDTWWLQQEGDVESQFWGSPGKELAFARSALGLSVGELATLVGVSSRTLRLWEKGSPSLTHSEVRLIAGLVGKLHEARLLAYAFGNDARDEVRNTLVAQEIQS